MDCYYGFWSNPIEDWSGINTASIPPRMPRGPTNNFINNNIKILINNKIKSKEDENKYTTRR